MACDISLGRKEPCKTIGGIKAIYVWNWDDSFDIENDFVINGTTEEITDNISGSAIVFHKFDLRGANSFDEAGETNADNGTVFYTTTGTVQLKKQDSSTRKELKLMAYGRPRIMVQAWDDSYKMYGLNNGCDVAFTASSGANMGDFNGYSLTITAREVEPANFVDETWLANGAKATIIEGV